MDTDEKEIEVRLKRLEEQLNVDGKEHDMKMKILMAQLDSAEIKLKRVQSIMKKEKSIKANGK